MGFSLNITGSARNITGSARNTIDKALHCLEGSLTAIAEWHDVSWGHAVKDGAEKISVNYDNLYESRRNIYGAFKHGRIYREYEPRTRAFGVGQPKIESHIYRDLQSTYRFYTEKAIMLLSFLICEIVKHINKWYTRLNQWLPLDDKPGEDRHLGTVFLSSSRPVNVVCRTLSRDLTFSLNTSKLERSITHIEVIQGDPVLMTRPGDERCRHFVFWVWVTSGPRSRKLRSIDSKKRILALKHDNCIVPPFEAQHQLSPMCVLINHIKMHFNSYVFNLNVSGRTSCLHCI